MEYGADEDIDSNFLDQMIRWDFQSVNISLFALKLEIKRFLDHTHLSRLKTTEVISI
jgi:hypothetical protein